MSAALERFTAQLFAPPAEFGVWPFWFWNDDLVEAELLRQLRAFHEAGAGGVVIHPRIGLSARVGYLTAEYFRLVRVVADECALLGIGVILYDEGSYPSGSAAGRVVAENPHHAARALVRVARQIDGPALTYWRPAVNRSLDHRLVSVTLARVVGGDGPSTARIDPDSLSVLTPEERGLVRVEVPAGRWVAVACFDVPSGGTIRGVLAEHEDDSAVAPPAGDIMSQDAVASFIRLTHDAYAAALGEHLGSTVVAMFTDEPSPLGRGARREAWPYTAGFDRHVAERLGWPLAKLHAWLPALWLDYGPAGEAFRRDYTAAVEQRIGEVFYAAQAAWCEAHGIALTGHPHASNDMASLRRFHWPGQDAVWRWVLPPGTAANTSGLEGPHSVSAKAATSAARAGARRRVATELFGAYGWRLSLDEAKWLLDWHLVRGTNLFMPHAAFYSVRDARAYESEPDVGLHNPWWPHFQRLMRYTRRLSWLLTDCEHVCDVAVLGAGHDLPWHAARQLYESQIDFLYIDDAALSAAAVEGARLACGAQSYRVVVRDGEIALSRRALTRLADFTAAGGVLIDVSATSDLPAAVRAAVSSELLAQATAPDLRAIHVRKEGVDAYLLVNEGEETVKTTVTVAAGSATLIDPLRDSQTPATLDVSAGFRLTLQRREARLLVVDPQAGAAPPARSERGAGRASRAIDLFDWTVTAESGDYSPAPPLASWTVVPEMERFSGTLTYTTAVTLAAAPASAELDLGRVGVAADLFVNGHAAGFSMWAPYRLALDPALLHAGENTIAVRVTNSAANYYEGALAPSGLIGPVTLHVG